MCFSMLLAALSSGGMYLKFDNSEDGFFPDNATVDLLNEIEDEYQASVDFIRVIDEVDRRRFTKCRHLASISLY